MAGERATLACLFCRSAGWLCALPLHAVVETLRPLPLVPLPHPVAGVLGVTRLRGRPTPVISTAALLGAVEEPVTRYVHLRVGERSAALAVADVLHVGRYDPELPASSPLLSASAAVAAIGARDAELLAVLDTARLLPAEAWPDAGIAP